VTTLVRADTHGNDEIETLRARVAELESALDGRERALARLKADLGAFRLRYRQEVGLLHDELDDLERAIAEAELGELAKRADAGAAPGSGGAAAILESAPRYTSDGVRRLFRDVAKAIHPDLGRDALARDRRHALMVEANKAYALGDEQRLRSILRAWETGPDAVQGDDLEAMRARLVRRAASKILIIL
jgi:hypothetical protein